jgi:hypothetical protein
MRFKKLIYIRYMPLTAKVFADFHMDEASKSGVEVEYWDFTAIFFKNQFGMEDSSHLAKTRKFNSYVEIETALKSEESLQDTLFISIMTFEARIRKLYKLLTKFDCQLSVFGCNMFPLASANKSSLFDKILKINFSKLINFIKNRMMHKDMQNGLIKNYDIVFLGGKMGWLGIGNVRFDEISKAETVKINSDDYDNYLRLKDSVNIINHDYILFLDEYLPLHPDTALFNIKNVKPEDYYPELNDYFTEVEKQFNMPVIIAAHPKANRYKKEDFFDNREVYFGKTAELSKYAYFVIAHDTTSINYPIAFKKKLHFITSTNIEKEINSVHQNVLYFSKFLGCNYQYFNKKDKINLIDTVPEKNYENYKFDFQTWAETQNTKTSDIFIHFLKN